MNLSTCQAQTVFIVDDDDAVRDSIGIFIRAMDIDLTVKLFSSAINFMEYLKTHKIPNAACLIIDDRMPGVSGTELINSLHMEGMNLPFLMISGHGTDSKEEQILKKGAIAFLQKPFDPSMLKEALQQALRL